MLRNKFVVVCKCPGGQHTLNCQMPAPGSHREINARGLPGGGGMLADGIDSHVSLRTKKHVTRNTYIFLLGLRYFQDTVYLRKKLYEYGILKEKMIEIRDMFKHYIGISRDKYCKFSQRIKIFFVFHRFRIFSLRLFHAYVCSLSARIMGW